VVTEQMTYYQYFKPNWDTVTMCNMTIHNKIYNYTVPEGILFFDLQSGNTQVVRCMVYLNDNGFNSWQHGYYKPLGDLDFLPESNLERSADLAFIDDREIFLEDAYSGYQIVHDEHYDDDYLNHYLLQYAQLSPDKKWIGGVVEGAYYNPITNSPYVRPGNSTNPNFTWYRLQLWDAETGQSLVKGISPFVDLAYGLDLKNNYFLTPTFKYLYLPLIRTSFSPDGRYFAASFFNGMDKIGDYRIMHTAAHLIDGKEKKFLPANRDVSFTSDSRYYVTERDGLPSLVDAETQDVIVRYDPGSVMTACCLSLDEKKIYIACEDLQVYEFESKRSF
jgi:hypothetical protein